MKDLFFLEIFIKGCCVLGWVFSGEEGGKEGGKGGERDIDGEKKGGEGRKRIV